MTQVVLTIEPNPKRPGTGAHARYALYYVGATEADLIDRGLTGRDVKWDVGQGHVVFGEGERRADPPPVPEAPAPTPVRTRTTTRAVPETQAAASVPATAPRDTLESLALPATRVVAEPHGSDKPAAYWRTPILVKASCAVGDQGRVWRVDAHLPDGLKLYREVPSDRLAMGVVTTAVVHGVDPDDWRRAET